MTSSSSVHRLARSGASFAIVATGVALLAGCASGSNGDSAATSEPSSANASGGAAPSGVAGLIASIADGVIQVQSADEQNAVSFDDGTTVERTISTDLTAVVVGTCVVVVGSTDGAEEDADGDVAVTAESIVVSDSVDGECTGGFGGGGSRPDGAPDGDGDEGEMPTPPSGAPADGEAPPDGAESPGGPAGGGFVVGAVSAVGDGTLSVESSTGEETTTRAVSTTVDTTVTTTVASDASALTVGSCVAVDGDADDGGTVVATALTVSDPVDGECAIGLRGGGGQPGSESSDE